MIDILFIDDDEEIIDNLIDYIKTTSDIEIISKLFIMKETDSQKALEIVKTKKIDILIVDLKMPQINGHQLLLAAHKNNSYQHAILFSAYANKEIIQDMLNSHLIDKVILKPPKMSEFRDQLLDSIKYIEGNKEYNNVIDRIANVILNGKKIESVIEDIYKSMINHTNNIAKITEKTGINKDKLYIIKRKMESSSSKGQKDD